MRDYLRVLSIRKHKTVSFINAYSSSGSTKQYMIDNSLINNINCGYLIDCNIIDSINNKGNPIKRITNVNKIIPCYNFQSYKGVNNDINNQEYDDYLNSHNCGSQLKLLFFKRDLLNSIRIYLNSIDYFEATSLLNTVENYANGSNIKDAIIEGRGIGEPKYLRVSMEGQLKELTSIILKSTYAIEKVFRNMGEDATHINEFLMLELVSIKETMDDLLKFIKYLDNTVKELSSNYGINIPNRDLEFIDFNELNTNNYEKERKNFNNTIVVNYPCSSPFILKDDNGFRTENRWYINGHLISHYYKDEYNYENVKEAIENQNLLTGKEDVNPMEYFKCGLVPSISLGLSIDRYLSMLMDLNNMKSISNPIALDYKRRLKQ